MHALVLPVLGTLCLLLAVWSAAGAADKGTWAFEVLPLTAVLVVFAATARRFRFTTMVYVLLTCFYAIQCVGGRYTFAAVPLPAWLTELLGTTRNSVDRVGHFLQGLVPAMLFRELLLRGTPLHAGLSLAALVTACCLAFSAFYELLEMWVVVLFYPGSGPEWLGMQGDPWDAQWDMTMALLGAVIAQLALGRLHDRALARMGAGSNRD